jgi:excinuclease ABC subunit A
MISLRRVAVNNLKDIDIDLPLGKLIVFCGRSGSGKSSLALDTLYAEGQRRYIETFSPAMRQFLEKIEKPKAERLDSIPPAIAVTSTITSTQRKMESMTVGDATELHDYLAMLFAQVGCVFCPKCSRPITADTQQTVWQKLSTFADKGTKLQIAFAPPLEKTPGEFAALWKEQGLLRGCFKSTTFRLDEPIPNELYQEGLLLIVDRLTFDLTEEERTIESLETAFDYGEGKCFILLEQQAIPFSRSLSCEYCNVHVPPLTAKLFRTDWCNHVHLHSPTQSAALDADVHSPTMNDLCRLTIAKLREYLAGTPAFTMVEQIQSRLRFMQQVGLDYLTLSRPMDTLSGGEQRRIALTAALGSSLVDMLYVLDEPSLGLHEKDTAKLLEAILELRDRGNTVILVEHDKQLLRHADHIVEIGPGAGKDGGSIVFQGSIDELRNDSKSLTGKYLEYSLCPPCNLCVLRDKELTTKDTKISQRTQREYVSLTNCTGNNLKNITATFPLGMLCVITGVSGSGKSSLIRQTLYPALCQHFGKKCEVPGLTSEQVNVKGNINDVVLIDQTPMGRSSSSNPATYLKIFDDIRSVHRQH